MGSYIRYVNELFIDRVHRLPRIWSNKELRKFQHLFHGDIANISAWNDFDKENKHYRNYFTNAKSYTITNYKAKARGFQGLENEIFLDLEQELPNDLQEKFDVVYNHTTLEHIYSVHKAFANLCALSKDIVILVVPFLQQYHSDYGDYWRFTPLTVKKLFEENKYKLLYLNFNNHKKASVYIFAIATRQEEKWEKKFNYTFTCKAANGHGSEPYIRLSRNNKLNV